MKILLLADEESKSLWDYFEKEKLEGIDLIISCGDLKAEYLSFLATFTTAPVLYVHGNHDGEYPLRPPCRQQGHASPGYRFFSGEEAGGGVFALCSAFPARCTDSPDYYISCSRPGRQCEAPGM